MGDPQAPRPGRPFALLSLAAAFLFTSYFMTSTLAPLLAVSLGASPATLGLIVSATFLFPLFLAIPTGQLVDRVGGKPVAIAGTLLLFAAPVWVAIDASIAALLALQVLTGLGQLLAVIAAQSLVARFGEGRARERNYGVYGAFVSAGQLLGPITAGVVLDASNFPASFTLAAAIAGLGVLTFTVAQLPRAMRAHMGADTQGAASAGASATSTSPRDAAPSHRPAAQGAHEARPGAGHPLVRALRHVTQLLTYPSVRTGLWVSGTIMIVMIIHNSFLPAYLEGFAVPATVIGAVISTRSLVAVAVRPFMASIIAALGGRVPTFILTLVLAALGTAGIAIGPGLVTQLLAAAALGVAVGVAQPLTMVAVVEDVATERHGFALGTRITANRIAQFSAPLAIGALAQAFGYTVTFLLSAGFLTLMTLALPLVQRTQDTRDAAGAR